MSREAHTAERWATFERYGYRALPILRETPGRIICRDGEREAYVRRGEELFVGDAATALSLVEKLTSSKALARQEAQAAMLRHHERISRLIDAAIQSATREG